MCTLGFQDAAFTLLVVLLHLAAVIDFTEVLFRMY